MSMEDSVAALFVALAGYFVVLGILGIVAYVMTSLAFFRLGKSQNNSHAWFAWIPILNGYLMGELIGDKVKLFNWIIPSAKWILVFSGLAVSITQSLFTSGALSFIPVVVSIAVLIYTIAAFYRLFNLYKPESAVLYTVLYFVLTFTIVGPAIFLLLISKNQPQEYL